MKGIPISKIKLGNVRDFALESDQLNLTRIKQHRQFFQKLAKDLNLKRISDWNNVSEDEIKSRGGISILAQYNGVLKNALKVAYPRHWPQFKEKPKLMIPKPKRAPYNHWNGINNRRKFFDELASDLKIQKPSDWHKVTVEYVIQRGGSGLLRLYYQNSLYKALKHVYPEHDWNPEEFRIPAVRAPWGYWSPKENQKKIFDEIAKELGIKKPRDWSKVTVEMLSKTQAKSPLSKYYGNSVYRALVAIYPDVKWEPSWFENIPVFPAGYWQSKENQRTFLDYLGRELGIK